MRTTIYSHDSSSNIEIAIDIPKAEEITFTLVTNKKHERKDEATFLPSISSSNSKSKISLISQDFSLPKAITTCLASNLVITHSSLAMTSSLVIITSKTIKSQMIPFSVLLVSNPKYYKTNLKSDFPREATIGAIAC